MSVITPLHFLQSQKSSIFCLSFHVSDLLNMCVTQCLCLFEFLAFFCVAKGVEAFVSLFIKQIRILNENYF